MTAPLNISEVTEAGDLAQTVVLTGPDGMTASILTLGARLIDLRLPDGRPLVLSFSDLSEIEGDDASVNVAVGRVANRIRAGRASLYPDMYAMQLELNDSGVNHLHGGSNSWDRRLYTVRARTAASVTLGRVSPDGEQLHPSDVDVAVTYALAGAGALSVTFATTNAGARPTQTNMTLHPYFDLSGRNGTVEGGVLDYTLHAPTCTKYLVLDATNAPTGEVADVAGTRFDFTSERPIADDPATFDGYDQFLVARDPAAHQQEQHQKQKKQKKEHPHQKQHPHQQRQGDDDEQEDPVLLTAVAPAGEWGDAVKLEVATNQPGLQIYTANGMDGSNVRGFAKYGSLAIEPSEYVDAGNHANFPQVVLEPGEQRVQTITYRFTTL